MPPDSPSAEPIPLSAWQALARPEAAPLLAETAEPVGPGLIERLRRRWPAEQVAAAVALARARRSAAGRIEAPALIADPEGAEQASSTLAARHKARRFAAFAPRAILDLCCGVGGDAIELARVAQVLAVDRRPSRAWMARHNARCAAVCCELATLSPGKLPFHLDPSRRLPQGGPRVWRFEDYQPGPEEIRSWLARSPTGAIKLGPGVDLDALPSGELELLSERGHLTQAVLWTGELAGLPAGSRRATRLPGGESFAAAPGPLPLGPQRRHVLVPDPTLERAGLLGPFARQHGLHALHPALGLLTADAPPENPWLTAFEVEAEMSWNERDVGRWLRAHDGGSVELRQRGTSLDHARLVRALSGPGATARVVFVLRWEQRLRALVTRRPRALIPSE